MQVWLNGRFVPADAAQVSIFDAGVQHAIGLFETMGAANGQVFRAAAHMRRLQRSASELLLTERLNVEPLVEALHLALRENQLERARVRLTITGGNLAALPASGRSSVDPTIFIVAQPPTAYPPAYFEQGVMAMIADGRLNPLDPMAGHKTLSYWPRIRALQIATGKRASEALWFTVSNHLAGGSVSNIFLLKGDILRTPIARDEEPEGGLPSTVRPGVTREVMIELAEAQGRTVTREMLDYEDLTTADEVFLTNSSWGVLPIVQIERERIGEGRVGDATRTLREAWLARVEAETQDGSAVGEDR